MRHPASLSMVLLIAAAGCNGGDSSADAMPDPRCLEAESHSDLEWIQENVFSRSCANFTSCHMGTAPSAGGLNLEDGMTQENVVDVESDLAPEMDIVEPGSPADSYMMVILGEFGADDPRIDPSVGLMPFNNEPLCAEKRAAIGRWIEAGALPVLGAAHEPNRSGRNFLTNKRFTW